MTTTYASAEPSRSTSAPGPLAGVSVVDVSTMGPGPYASMVLADFGAEVVEVSRPGPEEVGAAGTFRRGKQQVVIDLRADGGADLIARLCDTADVFIEGYRPGTMERRGLGPDVLLGRNPRLVYARLTGWGQDGPYARTAGHDINYIAIAGALGVLGRDEPVPPLNLVGDTAGGTFPLVLGIVLALLARERTGRGQVVDAAMTDGAAYLLTPQFGELSTNTWAGRGTNMLSGAAPFYGVYRCADGRYMSVGAIEAKFFRQLLDGLGLDAGFLDRQHDRAHWAADRESIAAAFVREPRDHWTSVFAGTDACAYPVLELSETGADAHVTARQAVTKDPDGCTVASPAPRLSDTPACRAPAKASDVASITAVLTARGISADEIEGYRSSGALHLDA